jgi:serine/threonine protein kinase
MIGTKLAHYEITGHLGTGGMGEVYQAKDSRLGRSVAIKLLPDAFTNDFERTERFEREARVLASLNHSNIAAIHGIDESEGRRFLVMELVPGETLADRIKRGPIPIDDALSIAIQILDGLEAAHEKGVIHRDLKPANLKVTPQGQVKVLDFGLAKAYESYGPNTSVSNSPTMISMAGTNGGMILGTAAYMSPEQARGRAVDRRTDIFAFGCVLFEMLTGKQAFEGEDVAEILSRVLQREPDWTLLPASVPPGIRKVLRVCLEKDVRKRRNSAGDVRVDIEQSLINSEAVAVPTSASPNAERKSRSAWIVAVVLASVAGAIAWIHFREQPVATALVQFEITPKLGGRRNHASVSPDGHWVAYYDLGSDGRPALFVRDLSSVESHLVPGSREITNVGAPIWSTDSRYVAFTGTGALMKVGPEGGTPQKVIETLGANFGTWNRDGVLIRIGPPGILRASPSETQFTLLHASDSSDINYSTPQFLPDGLHYLFSRSSREPRRDGIFVASLNPADEPKRIAAGTSGIVARDPGTGIYYLLVTQDEQLTAQVFILNRLEVSGEPQQMGAGIQVSASDNGILAIQHANAASAQLAWYDRHGNIIRSSPPETLMESIDLSPDGSRLAVQSNRDIWLRDLVRNTGARFTTDPASEVIAVWSPSGDRIVFTSTGRDRQASLYMKPSNGATAEELLLSTDQPVWANDWSRDGRFLIYTENSVASGVDLMTLPMDQPKETRKPIPYLRGAFQKKQAQFSPDGRFVAYASNESGRFEIFVQPFPNAADGKWPISAGGGVEPRWSKDGSELFYFSGNKLMAVNVRTAPTFNAGIPHELFEAPVQPVYTNDGHRWQVTPDGTFLLETFPPDLSATPITIVVNWPELLKRTRGSK